MLCQGCGAEIDKNVAECPYCGTLNYVGAEKEYFEKLEDVKEDLESLEINKPIAKRHSGLHFLIYVLVCFAVFISGVVLIVLMEITSGGAFEDASEIKNEMIWQRDNFPILDELYVNDDIKSLDKLTDELYDESYDKFSYMYDWQYFEIYKAKSSYYEKFECLNSEDFIDDYLLSSTLDVIINCQKSYEYGNYTDEEMELLRGYEDEILNTISDKIDIDRKVFDEFLDEQKAEEYPSWSTCDEFAKKLLEGIE